MELFQPYKLTILVMGLTGLLLIIQVLVADLIAIKEKHTPGFPVEPGHHNLLFRTARAYANTNETIAAFALLALFGLFSQADPYHLNLAAVIYLVGRILHMLTYYGNIKTVRSIAFGIVITGLLGMFASGIAVFV